jgi:3'(2'), 5'-bisphosphate nucleotidase
MLASQVDELCRIAQDAGQQIMAVYAHADVQASQKADQSPLTEADLRAHDVIDAGLRSAFPGVPVWSEEGAQPASAASEFFLVDPLDGTKEFVNRNGEFTVNIGLVRDGVPILGIVHLPADDVTYAGIGMSGATRQRGATPPESIAARTPPDDGVIVVHSRSHESNDAFNTYVAGLKIVGMRVAGSALKFGLLAAGEVDLYPRFGPTMEWDTAAGHAVLNAAGGSMTMHDGTPFRYGKKGFLNPGFIARGRA